MDLSVKNSNTLLELLDNIVDNNNILWKFWLFYFLMRNKQLKKIQIGNIEHILSCFELLRENRHSLDEDITIFFVGYKILEDLGKSEQFKNKLDLLKSELENHWSDVDKVYFKNDLYTLIILFCDKNNPHLSEVLSKYEDSLDYRRLTLTFLIMENMGYHDKMKKALAALVQETEHRFYEIRDSEKIFLYWILWRYKKLLNNKTRDIRNEVLPNLPLISNQFTMETKEKIINFETAFYYSLLYDAYKESRISVDEVPVIFRIFGIVNGLLLIIVVLLIDYFFREIGYLSQSQSLSANTLINLLIVLASVFGMYLGAFAAYEIGLKGICANEEIKIRLKEWLISKYVYGFIICTVILGYVTQLI